MSTEVANPVNCAAGRCIDWPVLRHRAADTAEALSMRVVAGSKAVQSPPKAGHDVVTGAVVEVGSGMVNSGGYGFRWMLLIDALS